MLVPAHPARIPAALDLNAKANAETLAWFGTAYGRRVPSPELAGASSTSERLSTVADLSQERIAGTNGPRRYALLVVLGGAAVALLVLRTMPVPPAAGPNRVHYSLPIEAAPQIDASQHTLPDAVASRPVSTASPGASILPPEMPSHPAAALPPPAPLSPAPTPIVEARGAAAPAPAPLLPGPEPVAVRDGSIAMVQPPPALQTNLPEQPRPVAPRVNQTRNADLIEGQAHFAKGDLTAARAAFAKSFESGLPEAALALGNTFDPVSLAKAGVKAKGDPALARRWYRRAFELAMRRPARREP